jgi:hypothetical protein
VDDRGRAVLYLGLALLTFVVWLVVHLILATYYPLDYAAQTLYVLIAAPIMILGVYAAFRLYQLRYSQ